MIAIYARVSTEEQAMHGASITAQLEACRSRIPEDAEVIELVDAGVSGVTLDRPALNDLWSRVQSGDITRIVCAVPLRSLREKKFANAHVADG